MKQLVTYLSLAAGLWVASISSAQAQALSSFFGWFRPRQPSGSTPVAGVPEIDASTGLLAVAAIVGVMILVWERSRRASRKA